MGDGTLSFRAPVFPEYAQRLITDGNDVWPGVGPSAVGLPPMSILTEEIDFGPVQLVKAVLQDASKLYEVRGGVATEIFSRSSTDFYPLTLGRVSSLGDEWVLEVESESLGPLGNVLYRVRLVPESSARFLAAFGLGVFALTVRRRSDPWRRSGGIW